MCTSLIYLDSTNRAYLGRTLELSVELPYQVSYIPKATDFTSQLPGYAPVSWQGKLDYIAITMPSEIPTADKALTHNILKVVEGLNSSGLTFSVQSYPTAGGPDLPPDTNTAMLSAIDLGDWILSQFSTVAEIKTALDNQSILVPPVLILGGQKMPFHYSAHDATGAALVIEFHYGKINVYDNPVRVMTNAPQFHWHLTNLNNYTFLTNVDHSKAQFGDLNVLQPGAGIAKHGLPASDTSVDRFIRAAYYAKFAEKQSDPDKAVQMVAHIMNNFDRPRGITTDPPSEGSGHLHLDGQTLDAIPTEFTSWTSITDMARKKFYIRDNSGMSYIHLDLDKVSSENSAFTYKSLASLMVPAADMSAKLA